MLLHFTLDHFDNIVFFKIGPQKSKKGWKFPASHKTHTRARWTCKVTLWRSKSAVYWPTTLQIRISLISLSNRSRTLQPCGIPTITKILPGQHGALYDKRHLTKHIFYELCFLSTDRYLVHPSFYYTNNGFIFKPPDCYPCLCMQCVLNNVESTLGKTIRQMAFCRFEWAKID